MRRSRGEPNRNRRLPVACRQFWIVNPISVACSGARRADAGWNTAGPLRRRAGRGSSRRHGQTRESSVLLVAIADAVQRLDVVETVIRRPELLADALYVAVDRAVVHI